MEELSLLKFEAIHRALCDASDMPSITSSSHTRAGRTGVAHLDLEGTGAGGSPEQPGSGLVTVRRREHGEEDPGN
jgi:hypothetical protein